MDALQVADIDVSALTSETTADPGAAAENADSDGSFVRVPALDGVRAMAIVAVLLFHHFAYDVPGNRAWAGGFLGVDLFFVLSGYLITSLLLHEHARNERINFKEFWSRRARRLLPALFALIIVTALLGRYAFDAATAANVRGEAFASLFYVQNWNHLGSASAALSHTWSLSIEEQWYLLWPLLLTVLLVWSRRRGHSLLWPIALLIAVSATECALLFRGVGDRSYYGTDTRAQELLVGAALAVVLFRRARAPSRIIQVAGWFALALLAVMFYEASSESPWLYRGGFLLVALTAAILITALQQSDAGWLGRLFAARPLVAIGLISYGLYLYHYPIYLWLTASRTHLTATSLFLARVAVTGLVGVTSYFLIERPFRRGRQLGNQRAFALVGLGAVALVAAVLPGPPQPPWTVAKAIPYAELSANIPSGTPRVLVAGDTTAVALTLTQSYFRNKSIGGAAAGILGCDVIPGSPTVFGRLHRVDAKCAHLDRYFRQVTRAFKPDVSVLVIGPTDALERSVGVSPRRSPPKALQQLIVGRLDQMRSALTTTHTRFALLLSRCDPLGAVSASQLAWLGQILRSWARNHPEIVLLADNRLARCIKATADSRQLWSDLATSLPIAHESNRA
jgi:peptidoglycan/LPS O-acetylase OafA/YrhL